MGDTVYEFDEDFFVNISRESNVFIADSSGRCTIQNDDAYSGSGPNLGGFVWADSDGDGMREFGESGLSGITVQLLDASGLVLQTATTAADGSYSFSNVTAGQYRVKFIRPPGSNEEFTEPNAGSDDSADSDVTDPVNGTTDLFTFDGNSHPAVSAGLVPEPLDPPPPPPPGG